MTGKNDVLLTSADLLRWREEDRELDEQMRQLMVRRADIKRKLEAAEVLAQAFETPSPAGLVPTAAAAASPKIGNGVEKADEPDEGDTAPVALIANMRATGASLKVQNIKAKLIELGFGEKLKAQPNYHYSLAYRLTKSGKLLKRGSKYRAAPMVSLESETEAGGASARH
jgi:phage I-like protein